MLIKLKHAQFPLIGRQYMTVLFSLLRPVAMLKMSGKQLMHAIFSSISLKKSTFLRPNTYFNLIVTLVLFVPISLLLTLVCLCNSPRLVHIASESFVLCFISAHRFETRDKFDAKARIYFFFIGYGLNYFGNWLWDEQNMKIPKIDDVRVNENMVYMDNSVAESSGRK